MRLDTVWEAPRAGRPLVHAITNPVTINDCANVILAAYAAPTMAQDPREVAGITAAAGALLLNLGAVRARRAIETAAGTAAEKGIPIIVDPVAVGVSEVRRAQAKRLLDRGQVTVLRGNASEIRALAEGRAGGRGVEASAADRVTSENARAVAARLAPFAAAQGLVVCQSGAIDLVTDGRQTAFIEGGHPFMSRITGAGCMLSALTAALCAGTPDAPFDAAVTAVCAMKVCAGRAGEKAEKRGEGTASFRTYLIDALSLLDGRTLAAEAAFTLA